MALFIPGYVHETYHDRDSAFVPAHNVYTRYHGYIAGLSGDAVSGLLVFSSYEVDTQGHRGIWIAVRKDNIAPSISVDSGRTILSMDPFLYNEDRSWGGMKVFRSRSGSWVYFPSGGREPTAWQDLNGDWHGDGWWILSASGGVEKFGYGSSIATGRGKGTFSGSDQNAPSLSFLWPRWVLSDGDNAPAGEYEAVDGESPAKIAVGQAVFANSGGGTFIKKAGAEEWTWSRGGAITKQNNFYVYGTYNLAGSSWYQSNTAPNVSTPTVFTGYTRATEEESGSPNGRSFTLTFDHYGLGGGGTMPIRIAEIAKWRKGVSV